MNCTTTKPFRTFLLICSILLAGFPEMHASSNLRGALQKSEPTGETIILPRFVSSERICPDPDKDTTKQKEYRGGSSGNWGNIGNISDPRAFLVIAVVVATVAAFIVSNDMTAHRTYSFIHPAPRYSNNFGWTFGLRKTFPHAALEYGGSYMQFYDFSGTNPNYFFRKQQLVGAHLSFVHQVFYNQTPDRLRFYIGPSVNYVRMAGVGGIAGVEYKVFDRLKFDVRYELTTQTNQLQAGLFLTYQKKSPWEKEEE
jgi:hypothetical protein